MTRRRRPVVLSLLLLAGCGTDIDPVGTYKTTPESLVQAIEETLPPEESDLGKMARERLAAIEKAAAEWGVALELTADFKFSLTMRMPLTPKPKTAAGTWSRDGDTLTLQLTHEYGELLPQPKPVTGKLEADTLTLQMPNAPRFVLERKSG